MSYLSAQLRSASAAARTAAKVCEPTPRSSERGVDGGVYECANVRRSTFSGGCGFSLKSAMLNVVKMILRSTVEKYFVPFE